MNNGGNQYAEQDADNLVAQLGKVAEAKPAQECQREGKAYLNAGVGDRSDPPQSTPPARKTGVIASRPLSESVQGCTKTIRSSAQSAWPAARQNT